MIQQLLIRNLNTGITEADLRQSLAGFGNVISVKMHQNGTSATVRMGADEARNAATAGSVSVNGATLTVEVDPRFNQQGGPQAGRGGFGDPSARGGYGRGGYGHPQQGGYPPQQYGGYPQQGGYPPQQYGGYPQQQPMTARIQIRVENCLYPINNAVLAQALGMVAPAQRVDAYPAANQTVVGTAEFADYATADNVVRTLNGKSIYPDCCRVLLNHAAPPPQQHFPPQMGRGGYGMAPGMGMGMGMGMDPSMMGGRGGMMGGRGMGRGRGMGAVPGAPGGFTPYENAAGYQDPVVIVTGVPEEVCLKNLWTLMECYGNVRTLRRQFSARTSVIATLYSHNDLRTMLMSVNGCPFYGSTLGIKSFAGFNVKGGHQTEWNAGAPTDPATLAYDFSTSHHRGRPSDKANNVRKGRPSKALFVTNLSDKITDDMVRTLFTSKGYTLLDFERKSDTIVIVDLESIDTAVRALCDTHATVIEERHVKVSFSLWPPHSVPPGVGEKAAEAAGDDATPAEGTAAPAAAATEEAAAAAAPAAAEAAAVAAAEETEAPMEAAQ